MLFNNYQVISLCGPSVISCMTGKQVLSGDYRQCEVTILFEAGYIFHLLQQ
jgi:hypothetical protein